jgi:transcriptional regulator with XRE-family HTH domain
MQKGMSRRELAKKCSLSPMAISYYEEGLRRPGISITRKLAAALGVGMSDFLTTYDPTSLSFEHGDLVSSSVPKTEKEFRRVALEDYIARFLQTALLVGKTIPVFPLAISSPSREKEGEEIRKKLSYPKNGPALCLLPRLEEMGMILVPYLARDGKEEIYLGKAGKYSYLAFPKEWNPLLLRRTTALRLSLLFFGNTEGGDSFLLPHADCRNALGLRGRNMDSSLLSFLSQYQIEEETLRETASSLLLPLSGGENGEAESYPRLEQPLLFSFLLSQALQRGLIDEDKRRELAYGPCLDKSSLLVHNS